MLIILAAVFICALVLGIGILIVARNIRLNMEDVIFKAVNNSKDIILEEYRRGSIDLQNYIAQGNIGNDAKFDMLRNAMDFKLNVMQNDNEKRLDQMRAVVSEKLESSIEKRLSETFQIISGRLESVHKAMGEMHSLASGVGDLKRILGNVNSRGVWGEVQLENILKNILTSKQYVKNCIIKPKSREMVEFAIKLPGKGGESVFIPVDAKFPMESYNRLCAAREKDDNIDKEMKEIIAVVKKNAKDISEKYIHPPHSTDFGIMFLPVEGLYAEVLRCPGLLESIQEEWRVIITGPTTLSAIISSLNMGFRTLAIENRASEIWRVMEKIGKDFSIFSSLLSKTKLKLEQAGEAISLAEKRSTSMQKQMDAIGQSDDDMFKIEYSGTDSSPNTGD